MIILTPKNLQFIARGAILLLTSQTVGAILFGTSHNGGTTCLGDVILDLMKNSTK